MSTLNKTLDGSRHCVFGDVCIDWLLCGDGDMGTCCSLITELKERADRGTRRIVTVEGLSFSSACCPDCLLQEEHGLGNHTGIHLFMCFTRCIERNLCVF